MIPKKTSFLVETISRKMSKLSKKESFYESLSLIRDNRTKFRAAIMHNLLLTSNKKCTRPATPVVNKAEEEGTHNIELSELRCHSLTSLSRPFRYGLQLKLCITNNAPDIIEPKDVIDYPAKLKRCSTISKYQLLHPKPAEIEIIPEEVKPPVSKVAKVTYSQLMKKTKKRFQSSANVCDLCSPQIIKKNAIKPTIEIKTCPPKKSVKPIKRFPLIDIYKRQLNNTKFVSKFVEQKFKTMPNTVGCSISSVFSKMKGLPRISTTARKKPNLSPYRVKIGRSPKKVLFRNDWISKTIDKRYEISILQPSI